MPAICEALRKAEEVMATPIIQSSDQISFPIRRVIIDKDTSRGDPSSTFTKSLQNHRTGDTDDGVWT